MNAHHLFLHHPYAEQCTQLSHLHLSETPHGLSENDVGRDSLILRMLANLMLHSRSIRRDAFEKLAKLSAQSPSSKTTNPDLLKLYKRCLTGTAAHNGTKAADGVSVTKVQMVSLELGLLKYPRLYGPRQMVHAIGYI